MDKKKIEMAQEELKAKLTDLAVAGSGGSSLELAKLCNVPYDAEMPIPEVIKAIAKTASVAKGEDYEYFVEAAETKCLYISMVL